MAEYSSGGEGQQKKYEDRFSVMHYNDKTQEYKVLAINPLEDGKGIFLGIRIGIKGQTPNKMTLMLNKSEFAYLLMEGKKIYNDLK